MDLMVDFETFSTDPKAVVVSAGAVLFDKKKKIYAKKYWDITFKDQIKIGRIVDESTLRWWFSQSREAQKSITNDKKLLKTLNPTPKFLSEFMDWLTIGLKTHNCNVRDLVFWGNGACFDPPIFTSLLKDYGFDEPWKFWNILCYRTFERMTQCKKLLGRTSTHHNALDDAVYQASTMIAYYEKLGKK